MPDMTVTLDDKYTVDDGAVYMNGTQALVRLLMIQRDQDRRNGLNTAGYISGYRGSPLATLDLELWRARDHLAEHDIVFQPGLNEDIAATQVWGTQMVHAFPGAKHDGVFAAWYGKSPGVDRCGDVFKHGNHAGSAPVGGVLVFAGDDHGAKSTSTTLQSEYAFLHAMIPVLVPADPQEFIDFGLWGYAMSRYSGLWVGFKMTDANINTARRVTIPADRDPFKTPNLELPPDGVNARWPDDRIPQEVRLHQFKIPAALAFARANPIDRLVMDSTRAKVGIVSAGKAWLDLTQALRELGIDDHAAEALGLRVYKIGLSWPLEEQGLLRFADGLDEIVVVEEKRGFIEDQIKTILYDKAEGKRPRVVGKADEDGAPLLPAIKEIDPPRVARVIAERLLRHHGDDRLRGRLEEIEARQPDGPPAPVLTRLPFYCSGCPHNTSTRIPEGSHAMAGIGCHSMAMWYGRAETFTHMGGEGASWIGMAPFTDTRHMFQNVGDGTYYHSGILGIRAAVAAGVNVTFKILYNDAVAMTGGQPVEGHPTVAQITRQLEAEGVRQIVVVSDEPTKYHWREHFARDVTFRHRDQLDAVQRELREVPGVTALVYDQTCAAEKRRRRKRGEFPDPAKRVFINELVCEGCGDCGQVSNCISVQPLETEFGRKRVIDQSACNKDYSCLKGFCPSFVTIEGGTLKRRDALADDFDPSILPEPERPSLDTPWPILITGVGGTGIITIGQILGMAAHIEDRPSVIADILGLAQKGGPVISQVTLAADKASLSTAQIAPGEAKALIAADMVTATMPEALSKLSPGHTRALVNLHEMPTGAFVQHPDMAFPIDAMRARLEARSDTAHSDYLEATRIALALIGDAIATNMFLAGFAYQRGLIPLEAASIEEAIKLNGAAVEASLKAFRWGRRAVTDPDAINAIVERDSAADLLAPPLSLDDWLRRRADFLTEYQDRAYADRFLTLVTKVKVAEQKAAPDATAVTEAAARTFFRLMAYKDEYEVARLWTDSSVLNRIKSQFEGPIRLRFHLAPPLFAPRDPETGKLIKRPYSARMLWGFRLLKRLRFLRGTAFDPFGRTAERRMERRLITEYEALMDEVCRTLSSENHALAVELAAAGEKIRGYGHVKEASVKTVKDREAELLAAFRRPPEPHRAAA
jgi:indolepyruvate ferredoxin oxidoreductase